MTNALELTLTGIAHGGEAIGRHDGKVVFVPFAIPGETVRVAITEQKANWARARLLDVLTPSPDRVEPPCPFFGPPANPNGPGIEASAGLPQGSQAPNNRLKPPFQMSSATTFGIPVGPQRCGGCQWQHIAYERQLQLKQAIVQDQLARLGRLPNAPVAETWAVALTDEADPAWRYRNHVQFSITADGRPAYQQAASHDLIAVDECLLLSPALDAVHAALWAGAQGDGNQQGNQQGDEQPPTAASAGYKGKVWTLGDAPGRETSGPLLRRVSARSSAASGQTLVTLETDDDQAPELTLDLPASVALLHRDGQAEALVGQAFIEEEVHGRRYRISAGSFFQVNTAGAEALVDLALDFLDPQPSQRLLDAYAGVGLFALALAPFCRQVDAIEAAPSACADFAWNAADLPHVRLHEGDTAAVLASLSGPYHGIVVDPPRSGLGQAVITHLARLAAPRLVYVSCDPATLGRDAALLTQAGYRLRAVQPLDLFPQTFHVESVALWEL